MILSSVLLNLSVFKACNQITLVQRMVLQQSTHRHAAQIRKQMTLRHGRSGKRGVTSAQRLACLVSPVVLPKNFLFSPGLHLWDAQAPRCPSALHKIDPASLRPQLAAQSWFPISALPCQVEGILQASLPVQQMGFLILIYKYIYR